ncbi:unnamed protein product [Agarophyton chilense]
MHEPDGRLRQSLEFIFCWHQVEFHDMSTEKRPPLHLSLPRVDENQWDFYWNISPLLLVFTTLVVAYHSSPLMGNDNNRRCWSSWQVLFVEFGVMSLMVFLGTAKYGVHVSGRSDDWRAWKDEHIPGPRGSPIPLADIMIHFLRNLEATSFVPAGMSDGESFVEDPFILPVEGVYPPVESNVLLLTASYPPAPPGAATKHELSYEPPVAQVDMPPGETTVEAESRVGDAMA